MPKQSKSTKTEVAETTPAVNVPVEQAAKQSKPKAAKAPKAEAAPVAAAPAPTPAPVEQVAAPETTTEGDVADLTAQSTEFLAKLNQLGALFASLKTEFRSLEKKWSREMKAAQKSQAKRKRKSVNRQPSGFVKPTKISDELAKFLEKPVGTEMARTDVTREINKYIRSHLPTSIFRSICPLTSPRLRRVLLLKH